MKKIIAKIFSPWGLVPLIMALLCNFVVYSGCNALTPIQLQEKDYLMFLLSLKGRQLEQRLTGMATFHSPL